MMFDLDNTLYSRTVSEQETHKVALDFIMSKTGCSPMQAEMLLGRYRAKSYPAFVSALVKELGLDDGAEFEQYLDQHLSWRLSPNPKMRELLGSMNANLYLMSNNPMGVPYATAALDQMGLSPFFNGIVHPDFAAPLGNNPWPSQALYRQAMGLVGETNPGNMFYVDDEVTCARSARAAGWNSFLLNPAMNPAQAQGIPRLSALNDIRRMAPRLF